MSRTMARRIEANANLRVFHLPTLRRAKHVRLYNNLQAGVSYYAYFVGNARRTLLSLPSLKETSPLTERDQRFSGRALREDRDGECLFTPFPCSLDPRPPADTLIHVGPRGPATKSAVLLGAFNRVKEGKWAFEALGVMSNGTEPVSEPLATTLLTYAKERATKAAPDKAKQTKKGAKSEDAGKDMDGNSMFPNPEKEEDVVVQEPAKEEASGITKLGGRIAKKTGIDSFHKLGQESLGKTLSKCYK